MKWVYVFPVTLLIACGSSKVEGTEPTDVFSIESIAQFDGPWAMTFLPDGRLLVTEKPGALRLIDQDGENLQTINGLPEVDYGGQGGMGDVILHPEFADNSQIYLSYAEAGDQGLRGAAVARATLDTDALTLREMEVIWRQVPKVSGKGHFGHRLAYDQDGYLFVSSGERQKFDPAQDMTTNLGKIVRLHDDGAVPADNPFADHAGVAREVWSLGHRNPLGLAFDQTGQLWNHEMGPRHGDELNRVERGADYGYPSVSNGDHYSGKSIPDHDTRPEFNAPAIYWVPAISPAGLIFYSGEMFPEFTGDAFIGGLSSQSLVRVAFDGASAQEVQRFRMGARIREVEQGPAGAIWLLEDGGRLLKLTPKRQ